MPQKICYTVITGNYDSIKEPLIVSEGWRYICFTNTPIKSPIWESMPIPSVLTGLSDVKKQRMLKICPHIYLPEYEECIYLDGNITIKCDLNYFTKQYCTSDFHTVRHPNRKCIYEECDAVVKFSKDTKENVDEIRNKLESECYPHNLGLAETGLMYRKNTQNVRNICEEWGTQMLARKTHRDQLTFNYCVWKVNGSVEYLPSDTVRGGKLFSIGWHKR